MDPKAHLAADGYAEVPEVVDPATLPLFRQEADRLLAAGQGRGGVRGALGKSILFRELAERGPVRDLAVAVLGPGARAIKLTLFDKSPVANWKVPWHQDLMVAVAERREVPGFGPWSLKEGQPHVEPPAEVLEQVLAIRLHLDDTGPDNGPLRVLPGTHLRGRLSDEAITSLRAEVREVTCRLAAGDALLLRPLLLHASSPATRPRRRRVLHFEFSAASLPGELQWPEG